MHPQRQHFSYARVVAPIQTTFSINGLSPTTSSSSPPPRSSPTVVSDGQWEAHPLYGLVHTVDSQCATCQQYVLHLRDAKQHPQEGSFDVALEKFHTQNDVEYDEGFVAGYEKGKQDALSQFKAVEPTTPPRDVQEQKSVPAASTEHSSQELLKASTSRVKTSEVFREQSIHSSRQPTLPLIRQSHTQNYPRGRGKFRVPDRYTSAFRSASVEKHLRDLFEAAWNGDDLALTRVRSLAREAHNTPRDRKSWGQKFVLAEWRNPIGPNPNYRNSVHPTTGVANPRLDSPIEEWQRYYEVHSASLPRGVRRDAKGGAYLPDLRASRHYALMRPPTSSPPVVKTEYGYYSMELILSPGRYISLLRASGLEVASEYRPSPYDGPAKVTEDEVARHFARCGVTDELLKREWLPWAREHQAPPDHQSEYGSSD